MPDSNEPLKKEIKDYTFVDENGEIDLDLTVVVQRLLTIFVNKATLAGIKECVGFTAQAQRIATLAERKRCMKDACMYCAGHCPPYESAPSEKLNSAGNYTHKEKDGDHTELCGASNIISRVNFRGEAIAIAIEKDV